MFITIAWNYIVGSRLRPILKQMRKKKESSNLYKWNSTLFQILLLKNKLKHHIYLLILFCFVLKILTIKSQYTVAFIAFQLATFEMYDV